MQSCVLITLFAARLSRRLKRSRAAGAFPKPVRLGSGPTEAGWTLAPLKLTAVTARCARAGFCRPPTFLLCSPLTTTSLCFVKTEFGFSSHYLALIALLFFPVLPLSVPEGQSQRVQVLSASPPAPGPSLWPEPGNCGQWPDASQCLSLQERAHWRRELTSSLWSEKLVWEISRDLDAAAGFQSCSGERAENAGFFSLE